MKQITLGRSGLNVSRIAFGTWQLGGDWGASDENAVISAIRHAHESGINFFDTAQGYGSYVGESGSGPRLKLIANSMLGITSAAAAELLAAGSAIGLDRRRVFSIVLRFAPGLAVREHGYLDDQHAPTMFAVRDLLKDLELGLRLYDDAGVSTPLTRDARDAYQEAMRESSDLDISAVVRDWDQSARTDSPHSSST